MTSKSRLSKVLDCVPEVLAQHQRAKLLIYSSKNISAYENSISLFPARLRTFEAAFLQLSLKREKVAEGESAMK